MILPSLPWRRLPDFDRLAEALDMAAGNTRIVGGAVRDTILGTTVSDIDLATHFEPQHVLDRLSAAGIKAIPTGLAHGTITAVVAGHPFEITTLRRDVATDGRHAAVAFTGDWREDAARRDFTINALYASYPDGTVHDYFDGLADLAAGRVRFIGDPFKRIAEDHLRILRFFRFHARFGDVPDAAALDACSARARDLMALSRERIAGELLRLLVARGAVPVVRLMLERGIFAPVLPEIDATGVDRLAKLAARETEQHIAPDPIRRLAALVPTEPTVADQIGARLKLSNAQRKRLACAVDPSGIGDARALAYRIGTESAIDRLLLWSDTDIASIIDWAPPRLPISGGWLVEQGISQGPAVARLLRQIEDQWIAEAFPDAARAREIARPLVDQARRAARNS